MQNHSEVQADDTSKQDDSQNSFEEIVQVVEDESARDNILKALKTEAVRKNHFKEKLEKAEAERAEMQAKWEAAQQQQPKEETKINPSEELVRDVQGLKLENEKRNFQYTNNLSPAETDKVFALAKGMSKSPDEILKDDFVSAGIEGLRAKAKQDDATPMPSVSSATVVSGKTWGDMKPEERKQNWEKVRDNIRSTVKKG